MDKSAIKPGQAISLTTNSAFYKHVYESKVIAVDKDMLCISMPHYKGLFVPLNVGFMLNLRIFAEERVIEFTTEILYRNISEHALFVRIPPHETLSAGKASVIRNCRFITIASGKGGVGKTSFAINLGISLAKLGRKVLIFDADLGMANVDVLLKASTRYSIVDVIEGSKGMNEVITEVTGGLNIIAGGSGMQKLASLSPAEFNRITAGFGYLESNFDFVLIDTGAGLSKNVINFIYASDETIVLTTPEPHAITDAYSIIKVVLEGNRDVDLKLIVNKCETPGEGTAILNRISGVIRNFLNYTIDPLGYIPDSKAVSRSVREQVPFVLSGPSSDAARAVMNLADKINRAPSGNGQEGPSNMFTSFVSKFASLFRHA